MLHCVYSFLLLYDVLSENYLKSLMEGGGKCINSQNVFLFRVDKNYLHNMSCIC